MVSVFHTAGNSGAAVSTNNQSNNNSYGTLSFSFSTTMSYTDFIRFLKDVESSLKMLDVSSITFSPSDTGSYTYSVTLKAYWLK